MKILLVSRVLPCPPDDGERLPICHFLRCLAPRADWTFLTIQPEDLSSAWRDGKELIESWGVRVIAVPESRRGAFAQAADCLKAGQPWINRAYEPAFAEAVAAELAEHKPDLIQAESILSAQHLPPVLPAPLVLVARDSLSAMHRAAWEQNTSLKELALAVRDAGMEQTLYRRARRVVTISETEKTSILKLAPSARVDVVPNGVDAAQFRPMPEFEEEGAVVFSGAMNFEPNAEAMLRFARHCWPAVLQEQPRAKLFIVGKDPPEALDALENDASIRVTGRVEKMEEALGRAAVIIAPLQRGGGMKNKVLEGGAMGKAMVVSPTALEGIDLKPGEDLIVADNDAAFAAAIVRLLNDATERKRLGDNARAAVERLYAWEAQADRLWAIFRDVSGGQA